MLAPHRRRPAASQPGAGMGWAPGSHRSLGAAYGSHHPLACTGDPGCPACPGGPSWPGRGERGERLPSAIAAPLCEPKAQLAPGELLSSCGRSPKHGELLLSLDANPATGHAGTAVGAAIALVLRRQRTGYVAAVQASAKRNKLGLEKRELGH